MVHDTYQRLKAAVKDLEEFMVSEKESCRLFHVCRLAARGRLAEEWCGWAGERTRVCASMRTETYSCIGVKIVNETGLVC